MKVATGYIIILLLLPAFLVLAYYSSKEASSFQTVNSVLDKKIHTDKVKLSQTSFIKDGNGRIISEWYSPVNRTLLSSEEIPDFLRDVFILSEDQLFYDHIGFNLAAMGRALAINMKANDIEQGASTITQQLARNLFLTHEQSYNRKLSEILFAYQLEKIYSKEEILDLYINTIYFNNGAYGIEAAAKLYFSKSTKELSTAELLFLATIPNNPTFYDPLKHFDHTKNRQERLIDLLVDKHFLELDVATEMKAAEINLNLQMRTDEFPDYVTYVTNELKELISNSEGFAKKITEGADPNVVNADLEKRVSDIVQSGIIIETSLNPNIQQEAKSSVMNRLPYESVEGSVAVVDHSKAEIVALVGGKTYKKGDFHRAFQAYRQPGSAIKPLLVYAPFIETTQSSLSATVNAGELCINSYCPKNYGGVNYGEVSIERAFAQSYNTPAVRLLHTLGVETGFKYLSNFPFQKVVQGDHVLAAAVGGFTFGMSPLELTNAYTSFIDGSYMQPRAIRRVTDLKGNILYEWKEEVKIVWSQETVNKMHTLLNKVMTTGTARKALTNQITYQGGKTGTTNDYHDFWFIGSSDTLTVGVWIGKDMPSNIKRIEKEAPHLMIWKDIVSNKR